jgi:hypothetical protein
MAESGLNHGYVVIAGIASEAVGHRHPHAGRFSAHDPLNFHQESRHV